MADWPTLAVIRERVARYAAHPDPFAGSVRECGARPAQDKNQVEGLNAEIAYLSQANLTMAKERDAYKARLDEFTVSVEIQKPKTRKPEGPITTGIRTLRARLSGTRDEAGEP